MAVTFGLKIFPDKPITAKPAETRMGSGKGNVEYWVAVVKPNRLLFELDYFDRNTAVRAFRIGSTKNYLSKLKLLNNQENKHSI